MTSQPNIDRVQHAVVSALHRHWVLYLIEGVVLLVFGAAAVVIPQIATLAVTIFLGWLLFISGVIGLVSSFWMRAAPGFWWSLVSAVLGIVVGALLIGWPLSGAVSLTLLMVAFFWIEGVVTIMFAIDHRREYSGRWGWMLTSGIVDLVLGVIVVSGLPGSVAWAIGLILGVNLIFGGAALISMALAAREA
jgi:uncharacterized membrane protein HdeD (DUF308 family)